MTAPGGGIFPGLIFTATITIVRAPDGLDAEGNLVRDGHRAARTALVGVSVQPIRRSPSSETLADDRDVVITSWRGYTPPGRDADVRATDRIEWLGQTYEVTGEPVH
ncbi:hypothetical protein [Sciscionella marina]|uniref:hypothetical protein n=1 Tax=Sciscionella marina TaxID=508770 RepID=UPI00036AB05E|nr:hypothetical protein [Sciscionella marina]